ncbi:sensor histidine kinase RegB [Ruixingdingia sedimenti]|uniref:histidine kinase n=1 Tax=Ruixingdingia sedimenti TaxID=3073604 RepID=A0ABU1F748_9RHOB|nr:ActS/PrrB/RegB family redox-sensitive histidine kinase [Xinfangfangia sp. LG-4]MDR5652686.1 ActS/PrrB/RegB family redox-sensitive histidine kinase [Xinfangfangia sp. LG-4]
MTHSTAFDEFSDADAARARIRLRTLVWLRWLAVIGQTAAILLADRYLGVQLPLGPCLAAVGALMISNLVATFVFPENRRLSEPETLVTLVFDLTQLAGLLALTGGLANPFALLIAAPVTVSATALGLRSTLVLGALAIGLVALVWQVNLPLRLADGAVLALPPVLEWGFLLAVVIGVAFLALYSHRISTEMRSMSQALVATQLALAREQKLTDLGGVVAAAAHELGTPLATIKLVSAELIEELDDRDLPDLRDDAALIRDQADRCRDILRSMGRAGKDDKLMRTAPLDTLLREAGEPHAARGKVLHFDLAPGPGGDLRQPTVHRAPEILHGLRNLIQNAVDFAQGNVWIDGRWTADRLTVRVTDDGPGYPSQTIRRIGEPFMRSRNEGRAGYEGMGLGLFIAKTLLERSGAELTFANGTEMPEGDRPARSGAIVEVVWPLDRIAAEGTEALGGNQPFTP